MLVYVTTFFNAPNVPEYLQCYNFSAEDKNMCAIVV